MISQNHSHSDRCSDSALNENVRHVTMSFLKERADRFCMDNFHCLSALFGFSFFYASSRRLIHNNAVAHLIGKMLFYPLLDHFILIIIHQNIA